jgi:cell division cycle protein 37
MVAALLDEVNKTLDERNTPAAERFNSFVREIGVHGQKIRDLNSQSDNKLEELQRADGTKITSESYRVGFDSSHVNKDSIRDLRSTQTELLNPNFNTGKLDGEISANDSEGPAGELVQAEASANAKKFADIKPSDYQASREFISSHPDILQESNVDGLLIEAFNRDLEKENDARTRQYVHQAMLLQWCRMWGRDCVSVFFKGMASPGHRAQEAFANDVDERLQHIQKLTKENVS